MRSACTKYYQLLKQAAVSMLHPSYSQKDKFNAADACIASDALAHHCSQNDFIKCAPSEHAHQDLHLMHHCNQPPRLNSAPSELAHTDLHLLHHCNQPPWLNSAPSEPAHPTQSLPATRCCMQKLRQVYETACGDTTCQTWRKLNFSADRANFGSTKTRYRHTPTTRKLFKHGNG